MILTLYSPVITPNTQPLAVSPDLEKVFVCCTLPDDTNSTVHPVSVLNEENEHSKHTLPPVVSFITTDLIPNVPVQENKKEPTFQMSFSNWMIKCCIKNLTELNRTIRYELSIQINE